jgi:hypothetical protein
MLTFLGQFLCPGQFLTNTGKKVTIFIQFSKSATPSYHVGPGSEHDLFSVCSLLSPTLF